MPDLNGLWHVYVNGDPRPIEIEISQESSAALEAGDKVAWKLFLAAIVWATDGTES